MKIHLTAIHFDADQKLIDYIEKKASKLNQFFDRITDAQVFLKLENSGQVRDKIVELNLSPTALLSATAPSTDRVLSITGGVLALGILPIKISP